MAVNVSLKEFNQIASGSYNAGQIDFATDTNGKFTGKLIKINNHVHMTSKNTVQLSADRVLKIKESFLSALSEGGVSKENLAKIREKLGIPAEIDAKTDKKSLLARRFKPLTRAQVREILDKYANQGRGVGKKQAPLSYEEAQAAYETTSHMSNSYKTKQRTINRQNAARVQVPTNSSFEKTFGLLFSPKLDSLKQKQDASIQGENAVNERIEAKNALVNQFKTLFKSTLNLTSKDDNASEQIKFFGQDAKLIKHDGKLQVLFGSGLTETKINLNASPKDFLYELMGQAATQTDSISKEELRNLLNQVFEQDINNGLTVDDAKSMTREFASFILATKSRKEGEVNESPLNFGPILHNPKYTTNMLVEIAEHAINGHVTTNEELDAFYDKLARDNSGIPDEMKEMLKKVAKMPIQSEKENTVFTVSQQKLHPTQDEPLEGAGQPIVNNLDVVADNLVNEVPKQVQDLPPAVTAEDIKNFIADSIFSDETLVMDVLSESQGEQLNSVFERIRNHISSEKNLPIFTALMKNPDSLDTAVSPVLLGTIKGGVTKIRDILNESFKAACGETLDVAAAKDDFEARFAAFLKNPDQLPGKELQKLDNIFLSIASGGAEKLQNFINDVFSIDPNAIQNELGGFTIEPYKDMSPDQIKAELEKKSLNQLIDDAAGDTSSPGQIALFKQVLSDYFINMTKSDKKASLAAALRYAGTFDFKDLKGEELESAKKNATALFTGAILKGTSPLLQKMMQGLPRTILGKFASALDDMKSRLAPIPLKIVQAHLAKMVEESNQKIQSITLKKSLGAASVGEAFLCEFSYKDDNGETQKETFVVKIMRHDAESRVQREAEIFTAAAKKLGHGMEKTWEGQLKQYMTEFDFRREAENVNTGVSIYDSKASHALAPNVTSMKISTVAPTTKNVLVATVAEGTTVDHFFKDKSDEIRSVVSPIFKRDPATNKLLWDENKKPILKGTYPANGISRISNWTADNYEDLQVAQQAMMQSTKLWFHEALLGSGHFHGDAHSGNLMFDMPKSQISFIDFGNLYTLQTHYAKNENGDIIYDTVRETNDEGVEVDVQKPRVLLNERVELLRIILGAALRDSEFFLKGFENLLSEDGKAALKVNREKAKAILEAILPMGSVSIDACYRLQAAVKELQKLGLELPPQINCFIQSMTRMQNTIDEMNSIMNQTKTVINTLKDLPLLPENYQSQADPLDPLTKLMELMRMPGERVLEKGISPRFQDEDVPAYYNKVYDFVNNGFKTYQADIETKLKQSQNPIKDAKHILDIFKHHLTSVGNDVDTALVADEDFKAFTDSFEKAQTEEDKTKAIATFAQTIAARTKVSANYMQTGFSALDGNFPQPKSFASIIMTTLFNSPAGVDMMYDNFTAMEKLSLGKKASGIAYDELEVSWLDSFSQTKVTQALVNSAQSIPTDSSYKVEIGI